MFRRFYDSFERVWSVLPTKVDSNSILYDVLGDPVYDEVSGLKYTHDA